MSESKAFKNEVGRIRRETAAQKAPARRSVKGVEAVLAEVVSISREIATHQLFTSELEMGNIAVVMKKGVLEASTAGKETVIREKVAQGYRSAMASIKNMTGREPEMVTSPDELKAAVERLVKEKLRVVVIEDGSLTTGLEAENKTIEGARAGVDYCVIGAGAKELGERALQLFMVKVLVRMAVAALDGRSELFKLLYRMAAGENVDEKYLEKVVAVIDGEEEPPKLWSICIVPRAVQFGPDDIRNASDLQKLFRLAA